MSGLPDSIRAALQLPDPRPWQRAAREAQRRLAPELAYGRHHGPPPVTARQAAVVIALYPTEQGWRLPLTRRSDRLPDHPGQVSLPGGLLAPGEDPVAAGWREWEEEMGCSSASLQLLGSLQPVHVFVTNFLVTPLVTCFDRRPEIVPNADEVARVFELPLERLGDPPAAPARWLRRGTFRFETPYWSCQGERIWGATLQILSEFGAMLQYAREGRS